MHQQDLVLDCGSRCLHGQPALPLERANGFHHGIDSLRAFRVIAARLVPKGGGVEEHLRGRILCGSREQSASVNDSSVPDARCRNVRRLSERVMTAVS